MTSKKWRAIPNSVANDFTKLRTIGLTYPGTTTIRLLPRIRAAGVLPWSRAISSARRPFLSVCSVAAPAATRLLMMFTRLLAAARIRSVRPLGSWWCVNRGLVSLIVRSRAGKVLQCQCGMRTFSSMSHPASSKSCAAGHTVLSSGKLPNSSNALVPREETARASMPAASKFFMFSNREPVGN